MNKFKAQGLLWSMDNVSGKNVCAFCAFVRPGFCQETLDYLSGDHQKSAQNAQKITDLTWANKWDPMMLNTVWLIQIDVTEAE